MQTTLVIIPTYNEVDNVAALLDKLIELAFDLDVLVVDDNSPDGTAALVARYSEKYPQVKLCLRKKKMGLGSAYREGFAWALANRYDYVVQMDGDFSHSPEELPRLLKASQTSDITIGSRFCNGRSRKCEMNVYR
jgi:dolichol-phosphate mannosyltransferase